MDTEIIVIGGAEEIGANCTYLNIDGTGIFIDAGLHPRDRNQNAFPAVEYIENRPTDYLIVTHAHTDHMGSLPYVMRHFPHVRTMMTHATRDISHLTLHNGARLLRQDVSGWLPKEAMAFYNRDMIDLLRQSFEALPYNSPHTIRGFTGQSTIQLSLHWAGHILGSASVVLECKGLRIMHTGDIQFDNQFFIKRAQTPRVHTDVLIIEATNAGSNHTNNYELESKRLAELINRTSSNNGSILIPSFSLGKTQEILTLLWKLMRRGSIPLLPIFTAGIGQKINKVYDQYCYTEPVMLPGFEISDIPQHSITPDTLYTNSYMKSPAIVVASSGMMHKGTTSFLLAEQWMRKGSFSIAIIGYQDPSCPGAELLASKKGEPFNFAGVMKKRFCEVERFRFSAHASGDDLKRLIGDVRPKTLVITHGDADACDALALYTSETLPGTRIIIPRKGICYGLTNKIS